MRNGQNKRMRGRNRNKGHHNSGGHHHQHNPLTRVYESNGPEVKIRGTAHHVAEKYLQLARDANASGDYVTAENYHQHAEHYFRLIATAQEQLRQQNPYYQPQQTTPNIDSDGSFEDGDDDGQPTQGQHTYAPQQQQPQNYGNQQQPSFVQREQPQSYGGQQPQQQNRPQQHQQPQPQPQQQQPFQQPPYQAPPPPPASFDSNDGLPSFITGGQQPQPAQPLQQGNPNGYDNQSGDRFPRHRRRRHRGGPRPDLQPAGPQEFRGDDGPEPGNG